MAEDWFYASLGTPMVACYGVVEGRFEATLLKDDDRQMNSLPAYQ